jgi:hypothetical protein
MDSREIFPSMYKRNLRKEKYVENISDEVSDGMHRMGLEGRCDPLSYGRN